ncbi:MAG: phosphonoacetaldehyde hydrolase [Candidatus Spyradenecus sp.]
MRTEKQVGLVVFDWAGTTTDYGSQAPVQVFDRTFQAFGVHFTRPEINAPMGLEKRAHIRALLSSERGAQLWEQAQGRPWTEADVERIYVQFEETLRAVVTEFCEPIAGVVEAVAQLRALGLKIGSTTGYNREIMGLVGPAAAAQGYAPDCIITPDDTGLGRPAPFMIYACMQLFGVWPSARVVKVGDTIADIREGKNAGAWSVGLLEGSNLLGLTREEAATMAPEALAECKAAARARYLEAGADFVLERIHDLPALIATIDARLAARA